jgi:hypothetical protein
MWASRYPRVKEVLQIYDNEGIEGLINYYMIPGMVIPPDSWHERIAKSASEGRKLSLHYELNVAIEKLKYLHTKYVDESSIQDERVEQEIKTELDKINHKNL